MHDTINYSSISPTYYLLWSGIDPFSNKGDDILRSYLDIFIVAVLIPIISVVVAILLASIGIY